MRRKSVQAIDGQRPIWLLLLTLAIVSLPLCEAANAQITNPELSKRTPRQILVSVPDRKLAVIEGGKVIRTFPVSVGASVSPRPTGELRIVRRLTNPAYYHPGVAIPAGANNPLGPRWIGLSQSGCGIHGTNHPESVGHAASHGCIRLRNRDIKQLFEMVSIGDVVEIRGQRDRQTAEIFGGGADSNMLAEAEPVTIDPTVEGQ
jgi:lipoprotein-anchoring transpeptidase ErfK/SrfK